MRKIKYKINLNETEKKQLEEMLNQPSLAQIIAKRVRVVLMANSGKYKNTEISKYVDIHVGEVTKWTKRWIESDIVDAQERLKDKPRSGRPATITAEQWCKIMALACEKPEDHGVPITHWSISALTAEIIKQGIVDKISTTYIGTFLKKSSYNPIEVSIG